jgi:hypothetical protein
VLITSRRRLAALEDAAVVSPDILPPRGGNAATRFHMIVGCLTAMGLTIEPW